ncbi:MAG TPA: argininosuccinate lyase [Nitrospirae bacterium]|nr:argininosuccinate lyase [Nitrospirota bacterium]
MKKPWSGRFKKNTAKVAEQYTQSISYDIRLYKHDIAGSIAHAKMLAREKIISPKDSTLIIKGLKEIQKEIENGKFKFSHELEDIHMNIESALISKIGESGAKLHTARSRNDQITLDMRLYLREELNEILKLLRNLQSVIMTIVEKHIDSIMPGYTHTQRAQPVLLSHHLLAYISMFDRDYERFKESLKRINILPLGSCALAGTSLPINRHYVAELLGFEQVSINSMDSVSDRDFIIEFLSNSSILIMHLSRIAEELVLWSTSEFSFIEISDAFTTGSSIMPQKKNPDIAELIRAKTGRIYGNLIALLTIMKALPLTYNRDMQEDKEPLFDTVDTIKMTLSVMIDMLPEVKFNTKHMAENSEGGFSTATDTAEYLVKKGLPFRKAHEVIGKLVSYCISKDKSLSGLSIKEFKKFSTLFDNDIYDYIKANDSVKNRKSYGSASIEAVKKQISIFKQLLNSIPTQKNI